MYEILILRGLGDSFVDRQSYTGKIPPHNHQITLKGESRPFTLTIHEYEGNRYLLAHDYPLTKEVADRLIEGMQPKPM